MAPLVIDALYRKDRLYQPGHGYGRVLHGAWVAERPGPVSSIVIHSTNGRKGSKFTSEAVFLRDSSLVSCADLIGKQGQIAVILPGNKLAWHAGASLPAWDNRVSYGIEIHHAVGETYTIPQMESLTWRVKQLIDLYGIPKAMIETHRAIALPHGRKVDPSDWSNADFYAWRESLYTPVPLPPLHYMIATTDANVREGPARSFPVALVMLAGETAAFDPTPTIGESIGGNNQWWHRVDERGFVHDSVLAPV